MSKFEHPDNNYTLQVKQLIEEVYPKDDRLDSVYSDARQYFAEASAQQSALAELQKQLTRAEQQKKGQAKAEQLRKQIKDLSVSHEDGRFQRIERLHSVASQLISLCEGESL